jgi:hypothetical protein
MALVAFALARPVPPRRRNVVLVAVLVLVAMVPFFLAVGSLLNKSYDDSDLATFENTFTRHTWARPLALPYQYATAPIPAVNEVVAVTPRFGRADGCSTLRAACAVLHRASLPFEPDPTLTGFTGAPTPWNTFTALYAPLVDAGPYLAALILFLEGLLIGCLWAWASTGSLAGICGYAAMAAAIAYSTVENNLIAPHLIGAAALSIAILFLGPRCRAGETRSRTRLARLQRPVRRAIRRISGVGEHG